ncbi:Non-specific serine/threonine protein kinase [Bertholletia excelsa]
MGLGGPISPLLGNLSFLRVLDLSNNSFHGNIVHELGKLRRLEALFLHSNQLRRPSCNLNFTGGIPAKITTIPSLRRLFLGANNLTGRIPTSISNMSSPEWFGLEMNNISGEIPYGMGNLPNLQGINFNRNHLTGSIPSSIFYISSLEQLLKNNALSSTLPPGVVLRLPNIKALLIMKNRLTGELQDICLGVNKFTNLYEQILGKNNLSIETGSSELSFLTSLTNCTSLQSLIIKDNPWGGVLPNSIGNLSTALERFMAAGKDLSRNQISGNITSTIGAFQSLTYLSLSKNSFWGFITESIGDLITLDFLDLSHNNLSGEIASGGPFRNFTAESFMENGALCGQLPKFQMYTYRDLHIATNNFSEANLLGKGSFGSVYKGILADGEMVAVKILNLQVERALKSFDAECKILHTARHRKLVKVISTCSNSDLRALILQYKPNGSLEKLLYSHDYNLNLLQRLGIMIDFASALEYLHHGQVEPIVHCDLKPSNVLLDEELVAHVADFGMAKVVPESKMGTRTKTLGTLGYIAPVTTKGDIYIYRIMLLEILTERNRLIEWVIASLPERYLPVLDVGQLKSENYQDDLIAPQDNLLANWNWVCSARWNCQKKDLT